ncbi:MAG: LUD domain-containing protein [Jiangellales bacterium]
MTGRETILAQVREALADVPAAETPEDVAIPRDYRRSSDLDDAEVVELFVENVIDYGATVHRLSRAADLGETVREVCHRRGVRTMIAAPGFPEQVVTSAGVVLMRDSPPMSPASLDSADAIITNAAVGIAETGTIVLVSDVGMGRRALSLVPDVHLCVVRADQVVATVPEAMDVLGPQATRPITFISGGSATSDIELVRVEGVHGPRTLEVIVVATENT